MPLDLRYRFSSAKFFENFIKFSASEDITPRSKWMQDLSSKIDITLIPDTDIFNASTLR